MVLATAEALARKGWSVTIVARDPERLKGAADLLQRYGGKMLMIPADVADAAAVDAAADQVERDLGPIAAWVNNAMSTVVAPADQITAAEYARVTATTYLSQAHGTLAALRHMKPRGRGAIIQVSSSLAIRAAPLQAAYCGAKFAVSGFTEALRYVLIADRVAVYLPAVNTPQFGWSRKHTGRQQVAPDPVFDPRLCADAIVHAIEHLSHEVWVGRSTLMTTLAQAVAPSDADRKASKMRDAQLGEPIPEKIGDLDAPARGPAAIDGRATDRVVSTRTEFFTSRQRDAFLMAATGGVVALSALLPRLSRFRR